MQSPQLTVDSPTHCDTKAIIPMNLRFLAGLAAGYVVGTRAGRERYNQIAETWRSVAESEPVARLRDEVTKATGKEGSDTAEAGMVTPPVIVGPGPDALDGGAAPDADVVLPDLESSDASPAKRITPPPSV